MAYEVSVDIFATIDGDAKGDFDLDVMVDTSQGRLTGAITLSPNRDTRSSVRYVPSGNSLDCWISGHLLKALQELPEDELEAALAELRAEGEAAIVARLEKAS